MVKIDIALEIFDERKIVLMNAEDLVQGLRYVAR